MPLVALGLLHGMRLAAGGAVPGGRPRHLARAIWREELAYYQAAWSSLRPWPAPNQDAPGADGDQPPAVIVHGLLGSPGVLSPLARALLNAGAPEVAPAHYSSLRGGWSAAIAGVARAVESLSDRWGGPVDLVGHSLGGLAARWYVKRGGGAPRVRRLVSLAGPQQGTALWFLTPPHIGAAFSPRGPIIDDLARGPEPVPTWSIRCPYDHQVVPSVRAEIPGARTLVVRGAGHNGLLFEPRVHEMVASILGDR